MMFVRLRLSFPSLATYVRILRPITGGRNGGLKRSTPCPRTKDHSTQPVAKPRINCVEKPVPEPLNRDLAKGARMPRPSAWTSDWPGRSLGEDNKLRGNREHHGRDTQVNQSPGQRPC